jgi:hypothetical protein
MKLIRTACKAGAMLLLTCGLFCACSNPSGKEVVQPSQCTESKKIQHTVMFSLKHDLDATETMEFLQDAQRILSAIPAVKNFQVMRQVSPKNDFDFFFLMEFAGQDAYQSYNDHPDHVKFVKEQWEAEVTKFLEADFEKLSD